MLSCYKCNKRIISNRELLIVSFPPITLKMPVAMHVGCYRRSVGRKVFDRIMKGTWLNPSVTAQSFSFSSKFGVPAESETMRKIMILENLMVLPSITISIYISVKVPTLLYITVPGIILWSIISVVQLSQLRTCKRIEGAISEVRAVVIPKSNHRKTRAKNTRSEFHYLGDGCS